MQHNINTQTRPVDYILDENDGYEADGNNFQIFLITVE